MKNPEQWQVSGDAAALYERYVVRHILGPWAVSLVDAARLSIGERVLDVACGTGAAARIAAQRVGACGHVIGLDLNAGMLAVAASLDPPPGAIIEWTQRSALDLGLADHSMDVVLCQQGLQFFPDRALALREMHRVLRSGGRLVLSVWNSAGIYNGAVGKALADCVSLDASQRFCASRKGPGEEEMRRLAIDAGFRDVEVRVRRLDARLPPLEQFVLSHLAATPVAALVAGVGSQVREQVVKSVAEQLKGYAGSNGVTYPEESFFLTGNS